MDKRKYTIEFEIEVSEKDHDKLAFYVIKENIESAVNYCDLKNFSIKVDGVKVEKSFKEFWMKYPEG